MARHQNCPEALLRAVSSLTLRKMFTLDDEGAPTIQLSVPSRAQGPWCMNRATRKGWAGHQRGA